MMSKIREKLDKDEFLDLEVGQYEKIFLGNISGILLRKRNGDTDPHVCYSHICEDDEHWFPIDVSSDKTDSYWLESEIKLQKYVLNWIKRNCIREEKEGWRFRT